MKQRILSLLGVFFLALGLATPTFAGLIYQNFEPENSLPLNTASVGGASVSVVDRHEAVHLGKQAFKSAGSVNWTGFVTTSQISTSPVDLKQTDNDRLTFWIYALPHRDCYIYGCENGSDNTVGVTFYDDHNYYNIGYEVWTERKALYQKWTKLAILFSQLPPDFDVTHVTRIGFKNFFPGTYYFDDIHAVREDRVYQSFDQEFRKDKTVTDFGWKWNDADTIALSVDGDPVYAGGHSWKLISTGNWGGNGFQSEQQTYYQPSEGPAEQSFWHNNFLTNNNDRLSLWIYGLPENGMDNNPNVQFYDHQNHGTDDTKGQVWTKRAATSGKWTRLEALFSDLKDNFGNPITDFNFQDIDKIQVQHFWPGTFYIDDIRATGTHPIIKESGLSQGLVEWSPINGADNYRLQESKDGPDGPWVTIYSGSSTRFNISHLSNSWLRVRWEQKFIDHNTIPYSSPWSDLAEYHAPIVNLKYSTLVQGKITWNPISQTAIYQLQAGPSQTGPWSQVYQGPVPSAPFTASLGTWYRVRAVQLNNNLLSDFSEWSRPQIYATKGTQFVKASGIVLKDNNGNGNELVLSGVNLGNYLLTEDWMTGIGFGDEPKIPDEWTLRDILTSRFGVVDTENLFRTFENAYLNDYDFDRLSDDKVTLVRLPIYYRNLMDENGAFILNSQGQTDFTQLDRIVDAMSDRGIYILLDLHGAPGSQNAEAHSGRKGFNKLFEASPAGETYRAQTETFWKEIAKHYKDNSWVLGFDLLNEPVGAATPQILAQLYDRLYRAIRTIDPNHVIVMEGIWDWNTLPNPADFNWQNVMYQFHYYCPQINEPQKDGDPVPVMGESCANYGTMAFRIPYHKAFIDAKVTGSLQNAYQVPAMVGEFNAYDYKEAWEYYMQTFNDHKWSWTMWSYKDRSSPSSWGLYYQSKGDESLPKFRATQADNSQGDSLEVLRRKLSKFTTTDYHDPNQTLTSIFKSHVTYPVYQTQKPEILSLSSKTITSPSTFKIYGRNFGAVQGGSAMSVGSVLRWSDNEIEGYFPTGQAGGSLNVSVTTAQGTSNAETLIVISDILVPDSGLHFASDGSFSFVGIGMCDTPGTVEFYPAPCNDVPAGSIACNNGDAGISSWSETLIKGSVPPDYSPGTFGGAKIHCSYGGDLYPTMIPDNHPPVFNPIANRVVMEGQTLSFSVSATDADGDSLRYTIGHLELNSQFIGQTFTWKPDYNQAGVYTFYFQVDDGHTLVEQPVTITVMDTPLPDMIISSFSAPTTIATGSSISIPNTIKNQGTLGAMLISVGIYLSKDPVITKSDLRIGSRTIGSLAPGATSGSITYINISPTLATGTYYIGAIVDYNNTIGEQNEANNTTIAKKVTVTPGADLVITLLNGPIAVARGTTIPLTNTVKNQGVGTAGSFAVGFYLSKDKVITSTDRRLGSRVITSLNKVSSNSTVTKVIIPLNVVPGIYYLGAIADYTNQVSEKIETNNSRTGNMIIVR